MPARITGLGAVIAFVVAGGFTGKATHSPALAFTAAAAAVVITLRLGLQARRQPTSPGVA